MRALTWIVGLAAALWSAWWFGGSYVLDKSARDWLAENPQVQYSRLNVQGFPNRFDVQLGEPRYTVPGLEWQAEWLSIYALSYKPWHVIAALPPEQQLTVDGDTLALASEGLMASVVVAPNMAVPLERVTLVGENLALSDATAGWVMKLAGADFAIDKQENVPNSYRIGLRLTDFAPDPGLMRVLEGQGTALPPVIGLLHLDSTVGLDRELSRLMKGTPQLESLQLDGLTLEWGELRFLAKGALTVTDGMPQGQIDLQLRNWQLLPDTLKASGLVASATADNIARALEAYAAQSPDPTVIDMAFVIKDGQMSLGPFPLGPAPSL
ncbi:DUF2125 domain-containing protein [Neogemmobacter tilapiae]|uniref:DUF2125 domain-containing protein n=1 Tax=Neogemmobacter tilapiae TaxID=875041 RepID=A0A918WPM5_9RHOB|nr:DUF2125 domain-containing protein [Gemmobacter tilapiae]GHC65973.1 hypothetical protein GCM10007315_33270 [Gemmobacter tilapiae]